MRACPDTGRNNTSRAGNIMYRARKYIPNLIADMAECDANYIRLRRLFPTMDQQDQLTFGIDAGINSPIDSACHLTRPGRADVVIAIHVMQRHRYTTLLSINVSGDAYQPWIKWPCLEAQVYRDVKSAEITRFEQHRNLKFRYALQNTPMYQPDEKSQINKFFGELLNYSHTYGHSLDVVAMPSREPL